MNAQIDVEAVKASNPLPSLVERLTGQPIVRHKIRAPWREDSTPSVHIYDDGSWWDFGSGRGGDVLDFVGMFYFGAGYNATVHFKDVIDMLGGLNITPLAPSKQEKPTPRPKPQLKISMDAIHYWHESMPDNRREYYYSRGLCDPIIDQFLLGWDGERYTIPLLYRGVPFGVKRRRSEIPDRFPDDKYVSVQGSRKGIFNADALAVERKIVMVEGELDAILAVQYGFPAVTVTAGAASWDDDWVRLFTGVGQISILYDNDQAGRDGRLKVRNALGLRARIINYPEGVKDMGELIEKHNFPLSWLGANLK
jgi:hypothetical protein